MKPDIYKGDIVEWRYPGTIMEWNSGLVSDVSGGKFRVQVNPFETVTADLNTMTGKLKSGTKLEFRTIENQENYGSDGSGGW